MGYVGAQSASDILVEGLQKLEYRGYDSAGVAVYDRAHIEVVRAKGKLEVLKSRLDECPVSGSIGIGHTRWATHGKPSDENAHPHRSENVVVVHNGIIENHMELREQLLKKGFEFTSETDTEIVPFLVEDFLKDHDSLEEAVRNALRKVQGTFAVVVFSASEPDKIVAAKNASPLILGIGEGENFIASDIPALLKHTRNVVVLDDGEMAIVTRDSWKVTDFEGNERVRQPRKITWSRVMAEKEGYKHFMLKEIFEQPRALTDTLRSRVIESRNEIVLDEISYSQEQIEQIQRVMIVACGTSYHAALVGKHWFEDFSGLPVEVDLASEFRYRKPIVNDHTLLITISQSGETADTLAALEEAKRLGAQDLSICNVIESSIARKSTNVLYTHAGPEIGVASTKAFTTQLAALAMLALYFAKRRNFLNDESLQTQIHALIELPSSIERALDSNEEVEKLAQEFMNARDFLYLGRGPSFPVALEGALKLKEISYIHAEGYAGGEIKHGPIALIDEKMPVVALATGGVTYSKMLSNIEEVSARGAKVIALVKEGDELLKNVAHRTIEMPEVPEIIRPIVETIPMQLLAYHVADKRGTDVDQPRNLAKSVTVE